MNLRKPTDKALLGRVSESLGRNVSEPRSSLENWNLEAEPFKPGRRQQGGSQTD
jgi:hypothetical protein